MADVYVERKETVTKAGGSTTVRPISGDDGYVVAVDMKPQGSIIDEPDDDDIVEILLTKADVQAIIRCADNRETVVITK